MAAGESAVYFSRSRIGCRPHFRRLVIDETPYSLSVSSEQATARVEENWTGSSQSAACLRLIYAPWSLMCTPSADRLNRSPSVVETNLITTPFSFFK